VSGELPVTAVVIGAGLRGRSTYGAQALAHPERLRIVGVAEPDAGRRAAMAQEHGIAREAVFEGWQALLERPRMARAAIVATGDRLHVEPALAAIERGYHVLLEKPIAPDPVGCVRVVEAAERAGRLLQIGHVLRYAAFYEAVHGILASGRLGRLLHVDAREHVATWHMAHSYVRGKFRNLAVAAPLLLAKSCHDLDLLVWFAGCPARRVGSFGGLDGYRESRAPAGSTARCADGCAVRERCPHDAVRFYLGPDESLARIWPWSDLGADPSREARRRALASGPYGRCVYRCDNDVVDHQVVHVEFEGGATASFAVHGHASEESRTLRITGSEGELRGRLERGEIELSRHGAFERETLRVEGSPLGHFGGDEGLVAGFAAAVASGEPEAVRASGRTSLESHLLGFAAERARLEGRVVEMADFRAEVERAARTAAR
jgi:predicted dehydrogenase